MAHHHRRPSLRWPWRTAGRGERARSHQRSIGSLRAPLATLARHGLAALRRLTNSVGHEHAHHATNVETERSWLGVLAALASGALLALVLAGELWIYRDTDSVALLSDAVHNLGDVLTALPVAAAVLAGSRVWERRAGRLVALVVCGSALYAGYEAIARFLAPTDARQIGALAAAGGIGVVGNLVAAQIRASVGRRIASPALIADAEHARADALLSVGVVLSAAASWLGAPVLDPLIGLLVAAWMLWIAGRTWINLRRPHDHT